MRWASAANEIQMNFDDTMDSNRNEAAEIGGVCTLKFRFRKLVIDEIVIDYLIYQ